VPIPYSIKCTAVIKAGKEAFSEIPANCIEDPTRGAEAVIQRVYPIKVISVLVPSAPTIDYIVRFKKEGRDGVIRPLADTPPASQINKMITVSGAPPQVFSVRGKPAILYYASMEKLSVFIVNLATGGASDTTVEFIVLAEKG
jgi:hypothetical protein